MCGYKMTANAYCKTGNSGWKNNPIHLRTLVTSGFNKTYLEQQQLKSSLPKFQMSEQFLNLTLLEITDTWAGREKNNTKVNHYILQYPVQVLKVNLRKL